VLESLSDPILEAAADWFVHEVLGTRDAYRDRCRHRGVELFSVASAVSQYRRAIEAARL
jgi:hypothetical protein